MIELKDPPTISRIVNRSLRTRAIERSALAVFQEEFWKEQERRSRWQGFLEKLQEWTRDPMQFEDDGLHAPSADVIERACRVAIMCRDLDWPPPMRVVPTGAGGVIFEHSSGDIYETLEI